MLATQELVGVVAGPLVARNLLLVRTRRRKRRVAEEVGEARGGIAVGVVVAMATGGLTWRGVSAGQRCVMPFE